MKCILTKEMLYLYLIIAHDARAFYYKTIRTI